MYACHGFLYLAPHFMGIQLIDRPRLPHIAAYSSPIFVQGLCKPLIWTYPPTCLHPSARGSNYGSNAMERNGTEWDNTVIEVLANSALVNGTERYGT
jgi:hypothetical protein